MKLKKNKICEKYEYMICLYPTSSNTRSLKSVLTCFAVFQMRLLILCLYGDSIQYSPLRNVNIVYNIPYATYTLYMYSYNLNSIANCCMRSLAV